MSVKVVVHSKLDITKVEGEVTKVGVKVWATCDQLVENVPNVHPGGYTYSRSIIRPFAREFSTVEQAEASIQDIKQLMVAALDEDNRAFGVMVDGEAPTEVPPSSSTDGKVPCETEGTYIDSCPKCAKANEEAPLIIPANASVTLKVDTSKPLSYSSFFYTT